MAIPAPIFPLISIATARLDSNKTPEKMWLLTVDQTKYFIALKLNNIWLS